MLKLHRVRLRTQLIFVFLLVIGLVLGISGLYIDWQLRRAVEGEIGQRLEIVARLIAGRFADSQIANLLPGDETSRTYRRLHNALQSFLAPAHLSRILVTDPQGRVFLDTASELRIGEAYFRMRFDVNEIEAVIQDGTARAAKLFLNSRGEPFKAAYAPIGERGVIRGLVCVEGSASGLRTVQQTRSVLVSLWLVALGLTLVAATAIAAQITRPLEHLVRAAETIAGGRYVDRIEGRGSREVADLAHSIDAMRQAIAERQQRQQMMLAGIAHEIRNPLGGIELYTGLLQKQAPATLQPSLEKILAEIRHLEQIVTDFLEYARPASPQFDDVPVRAVVLDARAALHPLGQKVRWQIDLPETLTVRADQAQVRRIALNLLRNACEALDGRLDAEIRVTAREKSGRVELTFHDNGPGIAPQHRDKIFQPFFTTRHQGTGLGLAIVKLLAEENGGSIELVPRRKGCTFRLYLPRGSNP